MSAWRRRAKWAVYFLLFVNFLFYLHEDATYAQYVLDAGSSPREVLAAYVTSIDLVAWFTLIILFELESCARGGRPWEGAARWGVGVLRLLCYAVILHTSFANLVALAEFRHPDRLPPAADVCAYAGGWSLLRNRDYVSIDAENCGTLARGPELFFVLDGKVDMHVRPAPGGNVTIARLRTGEGVWIEDGQEHVAYPDGPARVLVVERDDR